MTQPTPHEVPPPTAPWVCFRLAEDRETPWRVYSDPVRVLVARRLDDVLPCLEAVERATQEDGRHAAGFIAYEAAPAFDAALPAKPDGAFPLLWFALFREPRKLDSLPGAPSEPNAPPDWEAPVSEEEYRRRVQRVRAYIHDGDTYQVNLTHRLRTSQPCRDPWRLFRQLIGEEPPPFAGFADTGEWAVCSASPELFFRLDGRRIQSRPMKGTAARGLWYEQDCARAEALRTSAKDRAENLMITDMVRNDLGRVAVPGSVTVPDLFRVERHATVWQMISNVTATTDARIPDIFRALFPPASITGAPKRRTMEIIDELETTPRRVYTGALGVVAPRRRAVFNVVIRTPLIHKPTGNGEYGVGGGIVWDSNPDEEARECRIKSRVLRQQRPAFDLLETLLWTPADGYGLEDLHLQRLANSAEYFLFSADLDEIRRELRRRADQFEPRPQRVRLTVSRRGAVRVETRELAPPAAFVDVAVALSPVDRSDPFLYHKTTHREVYRRALEEVPGATDVLLYNEQGNVTESTIANLAIEIGGALLTPPVCAGLLPGTQRRHMLERGELTEGDVPLEHVLETRRVYLLNSVRGMQEVAVREKAG